VIATVPSLTGEGHTNPPVTQATNNNRSQPLHICELTPALGLVDASLPSASTHGMPFAVGQHLETMSLGFCQANTAHM